ncbi:MAG: GNAT family N-acetyltransferase [Chloroflexota bacterium]|nr:GNAT family N-acetyltransferase [Chloroflexota bacterium]
MTRIRLAESCDTAAIARIQIAAWRTAYASFLPAAFLDGLDQSARTAQWQARIGPAAHEYSPTFVALDNTSTVRGFSHTGPVRDDDLLPDDLAEVYTIYVDPLAWRQGIGSGLMAAIDAFWRPRGIHELVLWVFEQNFESRAFYERLGWQQDGARQVDDFGGAQPAEARYRRSMKPGPP